MEENKRKIQTLADQPSGTSCIIVRLMGHGSFIHRLVEMGFVRGEKVKVIKNAPLSDPIEYEIMGGRVSLRRIEAEHIEIVPITEEIAERYTFNGTITEEVEHIIGESGKTITVALVGNPNCGKTSFFNNATGMREKVGNYSGVTVDTKVGTFKYKGYTIQCVDLPGTYSITEYSPEELYVRKYITEQHPDVILNIVESTNLYRNLFLTTQLIDMNVLMVMALNMYDELEKKGDRLDIDSLSNMLGFPIIPTVATKGRGVNETLDSIIEIYENKAKNTKHIHINYGETIEKCIGKIKEEVQKNPSINTTYPARYVAIKLLENDQETLKEIASLENAETIKNIAAQGRAEIEKEYKEDSATSMTNAKYGFIRGAIGQTYTVKTEKVRQKAYEVDTVLTNKWLGFPILVFFLWIMFQLTFTLGAYPQDWLDMFFCWLGDIVGNAMPEGALNSLLVDGIIGGVGAVFSFLPNILILFFFIALLEDSGYLARAAFMMDKLMHKFGLHGRSFIPYIIGFGCSVPAIMGTRTLPNKKDRILTAFTIPFMSCSARIPIYVLFVSAFFVKHQGLIMLSVYLIGILVALLSALWMKKSFFKNENDDYVMELPPYRIPTLRSALIHMWDRSVQYVKKMGTVILGATIVIWALQYFPQHSTAIDNYAAQIEQVEADESIAPADKEEQLDALNLAMTSEQMENSYLGRFGKVIAPVFQPLGYDWKMSVSILTGLAAKEVVVASMGVLYNADQEADEESEALKETLHKQVWTTGKHAGEPIFTPLVAYGFMIFELLCFPCIAAIAALRKEIGRKWMWFNIAYSIAIAWLLAFLIYQIGMLF